jgi:hypothetical protein
MAMKLLSFHNEFITGLAPDEQDDNFVSFDIIQDTPVSSPQLELSERIGAQALDRFRGRRKLMLQPRQDCRFQDSLFTCGQRSKLPISVLRDGNLERHGSASFGQGLTLSLHFMKRRGSLLRTCREDSSSLR